MDLASGDQPRRFASRVTPAQVVGIGLVAASLGWAAWLLRDRPISEEVELLPGTVLPSSEMAIVGAAFDRAQLLDHRTEDGRVWVPRARQSAYMRALVEAEALPREFGSIRRQALEQHSPWQGRAAQEELLKIAVQEELAQVICSMPGIERAAVLSDVNTRSSVGLGANPERTASVNIRTQPGVELEPARVQAIRVLVAASIAGLLPERVAVTDLRSGRVHAGPLIVESETDIAAVDPSLARRIAHEEHLAAKLRQALAYVKGIGVDVTVAFAPPIPRLPRAEAPSAGQHVASANTPASVSDDGAVEAPALDDSQPATIFVSLFVPRDCYAGLDAAATADLEQRVHDHALSIVPTTSQPDGRRVVLFRHVMTSGTSTGTRTCESLAALAAPASPGKTTERPGDERHVSLEAAWKAIFAGRPADVPREVWLAVIAVAAGLLGLLVLRPRRSEPRASRPTRRSPDSIDWSNVNGRAPTTDHADHPNRAAA
jgi:hypothetical protein